MKTIALYCCFLFPITLAINAFSQTLVKTDSLDIYDLNLSQLSNLNVTSVSKVSQKITEVPSSVIVITGAQIKERGYFTLEEVLSDLPGFQFRNIQGINSYVFQRGVTNQNNLTLLLIDGVQVNELNSGGFYAGGQYNLQNVERIEIIYGPASVAYGTNAMTGIINIITKNAVEKRAEINALAGSFNTLETDAGFGFANKAKTFGISVSAMVKTTDKANLKGREGSNNWTDLMDNFEKDNSLDLKIHLKDFVFGTNYLLKRASTATMERSVDTVFRDYGTSWNIRFINSYLKYTKKLSEKINLSSILYNRNTTVLPNTVYRVVDTAEIGYYRPNNLTGLENVVNYDVSDMFSVTGGLALKYENLARLASVTYSASSSKKPPRPAEPPMTDDFLVSVFVEPRLTLFKNLYLSGGGRYDYNTVYGNVVTPCAGINYHFGKQLARLSYAEAYRAPKPWDYTDGLGNSSLLPEKMNSWEAAVSFTVARNFRMDLTGYFNTLYHAIVKEVVTNGYRWVNSGKINTTGCELFLRYAGKKIQSEVNYTFNQSIDEHDNFIPEISRHSGNASVTCSFNEYLRINLRANYTGQRKSPGIIASTGNMVVDPCLIFHGSLSLLNYKGFTVQLIVKNILNTEYYHTSNRSPDRYRQPQRTFMITVGYGTNY